MSRNNEQALINDYLDMFEGQFPGLKSRILDKLGNKPGLGSIFADDGSFNTSAFSQPPTYNFPVAPEYGNYMPETPGWFSGTINEVFSAAKSLLPAWVSYKNNDKILDLQYERAKAGLSPGTLNNYSMAHEQELETLKARNTQAGNGNTKTTLMVGAGILAAILLLPKLT